MGGSLMRALQVNQHRRESLLTMQDLMEQGIADGHIECAMEQTSLRHFFSSRHPDFSACLYGRELTIPAGLTVVGKLHRHSHLTFILKGKMIISSEEGQHTVSAPSIFVSPAGIKRAFFVLEDAIIATVHLTKEHEESDDSLARLEEALISPTYASMGLSSKRSEKEKEIESRGE
jgi:quercetin dioxygenase-like cupin family protein